MLKAVREFLFKACKEEELVRLVHDNFDKLDYWSYAGLAPQYETRIFTFLRYLDQDTGDLAITKLAQEAIRVYGTRPRVADLRKALEAFLPVPPKSDSGSATSVAQAEPSSVPPRVTGEISEIGVGTSFRGRAAERSTDTDLSAPAAGISTDTPLS
jgi:hypothetical protein